MKKLQTKVLLYAVTLIAFFILIIPISILFTLDAFYLHSQPSLDATLDVYEDNQIKQVIYSDKNNLIGFGTSIKNPNFRNNENIYLELYEDDNLIRSSHINGLNIPDGEFVQFRFEPIFESENKWYEIRINSPTSNSLNALQIFYSNELKRWMSDLFYNQEKIDGNLSILPIYKPESKFDLISSVYKDFINQFIFDTKFVVFYAVLIITLIIFIWKSQD